MQQMSCGHGILLNYQWKQLAYLNLILMTPASGMK